MIQIPFAPTILEHAASLINRTPSECAQSADLMAQAHIEAFRRYRHPFVTVGMDIYNIEAEALGCGVRFFNDVSIPGVDTHPYTIESDPQTIRFDPESGRIELLLDAATKINRSIGSEAKVSVGICGPFSILIELLGFNVAVDALFEEDERIDGFLDALLKYLKDYCNLIVSHNLGVTVFDSWAAPPLSSPKIYKSYAAPSERKLISHLKSIGLPVQPLVIGGDTSFIIDDILSTGTTLLVSDYNSPIDLFAEKAKEHDVTLRANIDPKQIWSGNWDYVQNRINEIRSTFESYPKIIIGTGVMPYDTPPEHIFHIKKMLNSTI